VRFDLKIVEVNPAEDDACVRWGRHKAKFRLYGCVKTYATCLDGALNGCLEGHIHLF
jgi:hypothetical protein